MHENRPLAVFDLDGTLCDNRHREHLAKVKKWDEFHSQCTYDLPVTNVVNVLHGLAKGGYTISIWSARPMRFRPETIMWLRQHRIWDHVSQVKLHPDAQKHTPDYILKKSWLDLAKKAGRPPNIVFEDRDRVVQMYRANGITTLQVANGAF